MTGAGRDTRGEALRKALRRLSDTGRHDAAAIEEACRQFDLSPLDEEFLLREARSQGGRPPGPGRGSDGR